MFFYMNITLHSKGIDLLPEEKDYCREKANKILERASIFKENEAITMKIEIDKESFKIHSEQFLCTINLFLPKKTIHTESHCAGVYSSIDKAADLMDKKLHQEKEILREKEKHEKNIKDEDEEDDESIE